MLLLFSFVLVYYLVHNHDTAYISSISYLICFRKTLLLATSIAVGGTATTLYFQSRRQHSHDNLSRSVENEDQTKKLTVKDKNVKKIPQKRGNLRSLQVLVAIILSHVGQKGALHILSLVALAVSFCVH